MSQSITLKDARTQPNEIEGKDYSIITDYDGNLIKYYHASHVVIKIKDTPTYPEPQGDPSY